MWLRMRVPWLTRPPSSSMQEQSLLQARLRGVAKKHLRSNKSVLLSWRSAACHRLKRAMLACGARLFSAALQQMLMSLNAVRA